MESLKNIRIKTIKVKQVCPKHHIQMVLGHDGKPFCIKCQQEQMAQEKRALVDNFKENRITSIFPKSSLFDSPDQKKETFLTFKADKGSKEAALGNACYKLAMAYASDKNKKLTTLLYGTPGEGKTHLAISILQEVNERAKPPQSCLFIDINSLFTLIYKSKQDSTCWWTRYNAIKLLTSVDLLCLDDLGSESSMQQDATEATTFRQEILKEILDKQHRLIITTNLTLRQLNEVYNPKIVSRLLANSDGARLDFTGIKDKRYTL